MDGAYTGGGDVNVNRDRPIRTGRKRDNRPSDALWDKHREEITRLYAFEGKILDDVVQYMNERHKFEATSPMYKKRLRAWSVRKYKIEPTVRVLARGAQMVKQSGEHPIGSRAGRLSIKRRTTSQSKGENLWTANNPTYDQGLATDHYGTVHSPTDFRKAAPSSRDALHRGLEDLSRTPRSASEDSQTSGADPAIILTPSSSESMSHTSPSVSAPKGADISLPPFGRDNGSAICLHIGLGSELAKRASRPSSLEFSPRIDQFHALKLGEEAARFSSPRFVSSSEDLYADIHNLLATSYPEGERYGSPCETLPTLDALRSSTGLRYELEPHTYVSLAFLSCICHGQRHTREAAYFASIAAQIFGHLVKQEHEQVLASLDIVLVVLYNHGQGAVAGWLLEDAREAARYYLDKDHDLIAIIEFMIAQATSDAKNCAISMERLKNIYENFERGRGPRDPYTLIAGYNYAWRQSLEDENAKFAALQLLRELQSPMDTVFGEIHIEAIGNMTTTARILQHLRCPRDAENTMAEARLRIGRAFPGSHPYSLETERRHAELLRGIGEHQRAEETLTEVAKGRVEVLGPENKLSKRSIGDVEEFLDVPGREQDLADFRVALELASRKWSLRTPELDF